MVGENKAGSRCPVLVTEQSTPSKLAKPVAASNSQATTYTMRSVGHVVQKELNIDEATQIIQEKLSCITQDFI